MGFYAVSLTITSLRRHYPDQVLCKLTAKSCGLKAPRGNLKPVTYYYNLSDGYNLSLFLCLIAQTRHPF